MRRNSCVILSYKVKHNYDVSDFLSNYRYLLQRAVDAIWGNLEWRRKGKRSIPLIPKSREFKRELRNRLLQGWGYASHYVDSAIKTAYSVLNSWRRNYLKGRRGRDKPVVRREFGEKVRVLCPKHNVAALLIIKEIKGKKYYYARHRWRGKLCEFYVGKVEGSATPQLKSGACR